MSEDEPKTKKPGISARRTPRRVFLHPLGVLHHSQYQMVQGLQLSEGGLLFQIDVDVFGERIKVKDGVVVSFILPGGTGIVTRGEVLYEDSLGPGRFQYGVKFVTLRLHLRRLIRNYVTAKTQAEAEAEGSGAPGTAEDDSFGLTKAS